MLKKLTKLSNRTFENLVYDTIVALGLENATWRTPGRDVGRDIDGIFFLSDLSGYRISQRWYIECKQYKSAVDWPTIYGKLAYAESHQADFFLLVTTASVSPQATDEILRWNDTHRVPKIRVWNGYHIVQILEQLPALQIRYKLAANAPAKAASALYPLADLSLKYSLATYNEAYFRGIVTPIAEAAAAVADLSMRRFIQVQRGEQWGPEPVRAEDLYEWISFADPLSPRTLDRYFFRALTAAYRCMTKATALSIVAERNTFKVTSDLKRRLSPQQKADLQLLASWGNAELFFELESFLITSRL